MVIVVFMTYGLVDNNISRFTCHGLNALADPATKDQPLHSPMYPTPTLNTCS